MILSLETPVFRLVQEIGTIAWSSPRAIALSGISTVRLKCLDLTHLNQPLALLNLLDIRNLTGSRRNQHGMIGLLGSELQTGSNVFGLQKVVS